MHLALHYSTEPRCLASFADFNADIIPPSDSNTAFPPNKEMQLTRGKLFRD